MNTDERTDEFLTIEQFWGDEWSESEFDQDTLDFWAESFGITGRGF